MTLVIHWSLRDASPGATLNSNKNELSIARSKAKMPQGMTMRQWRKGPGSKYMAKRSIWQTLAPEGYNTSGPLAGKTATSFNNPPSGPPLFAFT